MSRACKTYDGVHIPDSKIENLKWIYIEILTTNNLCFWRNNGECLSPQSCLRASVRDMCTDQIREKLFGKEVPFLSFSFHILLRGFTKEILQAENDS